MVSIFHKVHRTEGREILAVCDKELAGQSLKEGELVFEVSEGFYRENQISEPKLRKLLHRFDNINLIGNKTVEIAIEEKIVAEENVMQIQGVKHVQIFKI